jgi:hypothetical protein
VEPSPRGRRPVLAAASDGGGPGSGPQASPAARALYLSLVLQPFPSRIAGGEEADVGGTCGEP